MPGTGESGTAAFVPAGIAEFDTVALVVVDIAALVMADIAESDIVVLVVVDTVAAGTAVLVVPIVYLSCSLYRLPSGHLSTLPLPFHTLPLGIKGSHAFACIVLPKMVLFCTS